MIKILHSLLLISIFSCPSKASDNCSREQTDAMLERVFKKYRLKDEEVSSDSKAIAIEKALTIMEKELSDTLIFKLKEYIEVDPYNREKYLPYARELFKAGLVEEAYNAYHQYFLCSLRREDDIVEGDIVSEYMNMFQGIQFCTEGKVISFAGLLKNISLFLSEDKEEYIKINKIGGNPSKLKNTFISHCMELFPSLYSLQCATSSLYVDVHFHIIKGCLLSLGDTFHRKVLYDLTNSLYQLFFQNEKYANEKYISGCLALTYANYCLCPKKMYKECLDLYLRYHGVVRDCRIPFQKPESFNALGCLLAFDGKYKEALWVFEVADSLYQEKYPTPHPVISWNKAITNLFLEQYQEDSLKVLKSLIDLPKDEMEKYGMKRRHSEEVYENALQLAGKTNELEIILLKKQKKILDAYKKRGSLIKEAIEYSKKLEEQQQKNTSMAKLQTVAKKKTTDADLENLEQNYFYSNDNNNTYRDNTNEIKEKIKTKGTANLELDTKRKMPAKVPDAEIASTPGIKIEDILSGKPLDTFRELFRSVAEDIGDQKIGIRYSRIESMMKALNQKIKGTKGGSSHSKGTLDPKSLGIGNEAIKERMVTLVKKKKLRTYNIEQFRDAFLDFGFYPAEYEDVLREKGLIIGLQPRENG